MTKMGCRIIETTAMEVFTTHGWSFSNRIVSQMWNFKTLFLITMAQNFVFEVPWVAMLMFVIMNSYMH